MVAAHVEHELGGMSRIVLIGDVHPEVVVAGELEFNLALVLGHAETRVDADTKAVVELLGIVVGIADTGVAFTLSPCTDLTLASVAFVAHDVHTAVLELIKGSVNRLIRRIV